MTSFALSGSDTPLNEPEHTYPPGMASTSMPNVSSARSSGGMSSGTTGRSFTTESAPLPWMRRERTTTPALLRARSGVSKKVTSRTCASSGSMRESFERRAVALRGDGQFELHALGALEKPHQIRELLRVEAAQAWFVAHRSAPFGLCVEVVPTYSPGRIVSRR